MWMNILTVVCCAVIVLIAFKYYLPLMKLEKFINAWDKCNEAQDIESQYVGMKEINDDYQETMFTLGDRQKKTTSHAEDFYYIRNIARVIGVNLKAISSAPGLISGLGVLGTFIGLTMSVTSFNSDTSEAIMGSIKILLSGMGTAFITSVLGMGFSSIYIWQQKKIYNNLDIITARWNKILDDKYYISELELLRMENVRQQNAMMDRLQAIHDSSEKQQKAYFEGLSDLKKQNEDYQKNVMDAIIGYDEEGNSIKPGDMLQNLYEESEKQSQALESFTTDLSNELNASLGKTMDTSIVPIIRDLENTHKVFNDKLDALSFGIQTPATDMVTSVVGELKTSMQQMTTEFKDSISTDTLKQMETLADNLTKSSDVLNGIPQTMQMMAESVNNSFANIKDIIGQLQTAVESQQTEMVEKSKSANEEMSASMNARLNEVMNVIQATMTKLNEQQNGLIDNQGKSTREIANLLNSFETSINRMKQANVETAHTLVRVQKIGENLDESANNVKEMSATMKDISDTLIDQQKESMEKYKEVQNANQGTVDNINATLKTTQQLITEYTQQYAIIQKGLKDIFAEISKGLQDYSTTLSKSTGDALGVYSNALDKSTKGLQNIAEALNESAEELTDGVDKLKMRLK